MILQIHPRIHNLFVLISENEYHTKKLKQVELPLHRFGYRIDQLGDVLFPAYSLMQWLSLTKLYAGMTCIMYIIILH